MVISNTLILLIKQLLHKESLTELHPVRVKFLDATVDVTHSLFGSSSIELPASAFGEATAGAISNSTELVVGEILTNFSGELTIEFIYSNEEKLLDFTYTTSLVSGNIYRFLTNSINISLPNASETLANFLLNFIFRGISINQPSNWYVSAISKEDVEVSSRLELTDFSEVYDNELGYKCISFAGYNYQANSQDVEIKQLNLYDSSTGGNVWFQVSWPISLNLYNSRLLDIYSNSFVIALKPSYLNINFVHTKNPSCVFYLNFDKGLLEEVTREVPNYQLTYNYQDKLTNIASGGFYSGDIISYSNFVVPYLFSIDIYLKFTQTTVGREIVIISKEGSFQLEINLSNELVLKDPNGSIVGVSLIWQTNEWYHIHLTRDTTEITLTVADENGVVVSDFSSISSGYIFANNLYALNIGHITKSINGLIDTVYISDEVEPLGIFEIKNTPKPYDWLYIDSLTWGNLTYKQWLEYAY